MREYRLRPGVCQAYELTADDIAGKGTTSEFAQFVKDWGAAEGDFIVQTSSGQQLVKRADFVAQWELGPGIDTDALTALVRRLEALEAWRDGRSAIALPSSSIKAGPAAPWPPRATAPAAAAPAAT